MWLKIVWMLVATHAGFACGETEAVKKAAPAAEYQPQEAAADAWVALFDGKTTAGWRRYNDTGIGKAWIVQDGALHLNAKLKADRQTAGGDIVTADSFTNFHLKLEWKIAPKGNSGIMFLVQEGKSYSYPWQTGPEMQILDDEGHPESRVEKHGAGDLYDLVKRSAPVAKPAGEWNLAEVIVNAGQLELKLNGITTVKTTLWTPEWKALVAGSKFKDMPGFGTFRSGRVALQDHGDDVWFKNMMIKRL
jgi:hypothetical protein